MFFRIGPSNAKPRAGAMPSENDSLFGSVTSNISLAATKSANAPKILSSLVFVRSWWVTTKATAMPRAAIAPAAITWSLYRSDLRAISRPLFDLGRRLFQLDRHRLYHLAPDRLPAVAADRLLERIQGSLVELGPGTAPELDEGFLYCFRHPIDPS